MKENVALFLPQRTCPSDKDPLWYSGVYTYQLKWLLEKSEQTHPWPCGENPLPTFVLIAIYGDLFNECLLNKKFQVRRGEESNLKIYLEEKLNYFHQCREAQISRKTTISYWEKTFISPVTYNNLRVLVSGWFGYASTLISCSDAYASALSSTSSCLELEFCDVRSRSNNSAVNSQTYTSAVCGVNVASINKRSNLKANVSENDVEDDDIESNCLLTLISKATKKSIKLIARLNTVINNEKQKFCANTINYAGDACPRLFAPFITFLRKNNFTMRTAVFSNKKFRLLLELSVVSDLAISNILKAFMTDEFAVEIDNWLWELLFILGSSICSHRSFPHFSDIFYLEILSSGIIPKMALIENILSCNTFPYPRIIYNYFMSIVFDLFGGSLRERNKEICSSKVALRIIGEEDAREQFLRLTGWAIHSLRCRFTRIKTSCSVSKSVAYNNLLELLSHLRTLRNDGLVSESIFFKYLNHGGLLLPPEEFLDWSTAVFEILRNTERIEIFGRDALVQSWSTLKSSDILKNKFTEAFNQVLKSQNINNTTTSGAFLHLHGLLIKKLFNVWFGAKLKEYRGKNIKKHDKLALRDKLKASAALKSDGKIEPKRSKTSVKRKRVSSELFPNKKLRAISYLAKRNAQLTFT